MIIDFHVHIFPDEIANKAISTLAEKCKVPPETNGTAEDTLSKMKEWGIDKAVCLNIATKPTQQRKINSFMVETASDKFIPFGTFHPQSETALEEISFIKSSGIKGIKLHPDYQNFYINEKQCFPYYSLMEELNLPLIVHSGYDVGIGCPIRCTPYMLSQVAKAFPRLKIIAAHFGGNGLWHDAADLLGDLDNVYFDTAFPCNLDSQTAKMVVRKKGAERVLFGSDCPWSSPRKIIDLIDSIDLSAEEKDLIFQKNAINLLSL